MFVAIINYTCMIFIYIYHIYFALWDVQCTMPRISMASKFAKSIKSNFSFSFYRFSLALQAPVSIVVTVARAFATTSSVAILQTVCCVSVTSSVLTLASISAKNCGKCIMHRLHLCFSTKSV